MFNQRFGQGGGQGSGRGKGLGPGGGRGLGRGGGRGLGRGGGGYGPAGFCICPKCGYRTSHQQGTPCPDMKCPHCGVALVREELLNDRRKK